jgi:hypothetical protein
MKKIILSIAFFSILSTNAQITDTTYRKTDTVFFTKTCLCYTPCCSPVNINKKKRRHRLWDIISFSLYAGATVYMLAK